MVLRHILQKLRLVELPLVARLRLHWHQRGILLTHAVCRHRQHLPAGNASLGHRWRFRAHAAGRRLLLAARPQQHVPAAHQQPIARDFRPGTQDFDQRIIAWFEVTCQELINF